jgi:hypothetical protein
MPWDKRYGKAALAAKVSLEPTMTDAANSADGGNAPVADLNA